MICEMKHNMSPADFYSYLVLGKCTLADSVNGELFGNKYSLGTYDTLALAH